MSMLLEAKRFLYAELLKVKQEQLTDNDISLAYHLGQDPGIQKILDGALKAERSKNKLREDEPDEKD